MPKFRFAVRSKEGRIRTGSVNEASLEAARQCLVKAGYEVISLTGESEIIVHEAKASERRGTSVKPERAAIIEFEVGFGERIGDFLSRFVLRKEAVVVFLMLGIALATYNYYRMPKVEPAPEAKYIGFEVEITIDPNSFRGDTYQVLLPDVPLRFSGKVKDGSVLRYSFEGLKQPQRAQVSLLEKGSPVAMGESMLSLGKEGVLFAQVILDPLRKSGKK